MPIGSMLSGGTEIIISGTGFGSAAGEVAVGYGNSATVVQWSDTEITVVLPPLPVGDYPLLVSTSTGYADTRYALAKMLNHSTCFYDM